MVNIETTTRDETRARWRLRDQLLTAATVIEVGLLAPRMRFVRLQSADFRSFHYVAGQEVRVKIGSSSRAWDWLAGARRTYSILELAGDRLTLVVFEHGSGPGVEWAREVRAGVEVLLTRPRGTLVPRPASFHLLVGEETASVAFAALLPELQGTARCVLEVDSPTEHWNIGHDVIWSYRRGKSAVGSRGLVETLRALDLPESGERAAYLAGEARTIQLIRRHLVDERGWARRSIATKPFWAEGKTGLE